MSEVTKLSSVHDAVAYAERGGWENNSSVFDEDRYNVTSAARRWREGPSSAQTRRVQSWMEKIDATMHDRQIATWSPSPHGAYAVVPEYLANEPFNMRLKHMEESTAAPITVWVELGLSFAFDDGMAEKRAAAIAALLMKLNEMRPVEAKIICCSTLRSAAQAVFIQVDLDTRVFDAQYITQALAMPEIVRPLRWAMILHGLREHSNIGFAFGIRTDTARENRIRKQFNAAQQDIVIQAAVHGNTEAITMINDPVGWVHRMIDKQRHLDEVIA